MWWFRRAARRLTQWRRRDLVEAAMEAEMRDHIEREVAARMGEGATRDDATRMALRDFGGVERHKEDARDALGLRVVDDLGRDFHYAARLLGRNPGFTIAVVLTFALGIGCTSAIFTLVDGILLRPLPYERPSQLVALWERNIPRGKDRNVVSVALFERWREEARSLADMAAMVPAPSTVQGAPAERITAAQVSPSYFRLLGVHPVLGRDFTNADELNGGAPVAILSDEFWRTRYGADRSVLGRLIALDGSSFTIIGVMPRDFEPPRYGWMTEHPLWIPFAPTPSNHKWGRFLHVIGRLRPGVAIEQARADLAGISGRRASEGEANKGWSATVVPLAEQITGDVRRPLLTLFAAVVLLLLMSIVNVANLVTTFTRRRQRELTLRRAIGATRLRLLCQQLTLSLTLGGAATAVGLIVAIVAASVSTFRALPDGRSALELSSTRVASRLSGSRLMTAEIAIGLVLSALATLMVRSFVKLGSVDLGFSPQHVAVARLSLPTNKYVRDTQWQQFFDAVRARTRAIPGVTSVSIATTSPFACCAPATNVGDAARSDDARAPSPVTDVRFVDSAYFATLRIPAVVGGVFAAAEPAEGVPHVVISRSLAQALWGRTDVIGRQISIALFGTTTAVVIGVVGDTHRGDARTPPRPAAYLAATRFPSNERDVIVRGSGDPNLIVSALRGVVASLDVSVPLYRATTLEATVGATLAQDRLVTTLLSAFAALALALAAVGVHGVLSADVVRRRKEIGIRVALGAKRSSVYALVLGRALPAALRGIVLGLAAAMLLSRAMSALVFGIGTWDPPSFAIVVALLGLVALVATWLPALRAMRVSPLEAIRTD